MAEKKEAPKGAAKSGKGKKRTKGSYYKVEGNSLKRKKSCPKCGAGVFMAEHKDRAHCGNCGYTEFR